MTDIDPDTKTCPFCAETIKAAAVVCRYCGRELVPVTQAPKPEDAPADRLDAEVARYIATGYRIAWRDGHRAQLVRPKVFSLGWALFWLLPGVALGLLSGIGVILLPLGFVLYALYYLSKRDAVVYLEGARLLDADIAPAGETGLGTRLVLLLGLCGVALAFGLVKGLWPVSVVAILFAVLFLSTWAYAPEASGGRRCGPQPEWATKRLAKAPEAEQWVPPGLRHQ
ncbi:MAG: zinc ribbon domain-containing protein [Anaerolineae bacterium]